MAEKKEYLFVKADTGQNDRLIPCMDDDRDFMLSLGDGEMVKIVTDDTRSLWRHKRFFIMLRRVIDMLPDYITEKDRERGIFVTMAKRIPTVDKLLICLKIDLGLFEIHTDRLGYKHEVITSSISFSSMGETRFKEFVKNCRDKLLEEYLVVNPEDFDEEMKDLMFG